MDGAVVRSAGQKLWRMAEQCQRVVVGLAPGDSAVCAVVVDVAGGRRLEQRSVVCRGPCGVVAGCALE